jgi:AcrR family transcriptional regulator
MSQGVKPATQARSRQTREKLVLALERLLRERDFDSITIAELAAEAGLSVGAVYRRFDNKDAFIPVIFELYLKRMEERMATPEGKAEIDPEAGLRAALHVIVLNGWKFIETDGHLIRAAHLYARLRPDLVQDEWAAYLDQAVAGMRQVVEFFGDEIRVADSEVAAQMLTYLLNVLMIEKGLYPEDGIAAALTMSNEVFTRSIADTMYGYLTTPEPDERA